MRHGTRRKSKYRAGGEARRRSLGDRFRVIRDILSLHRCALLPDDYLARVVIEDRPQLEPAPVSDLQVIASLECSEDGASFPRHAYPMLTWQDTSSNGDYLTD